MRVFVIFLILLTGCKEQPAKAQGLIDYGVQGGRSYISSTQSTTGRIYISGANNTIEKTVNVSYPSSTNINQLSQLWQHKLKALARGENVKFRIVQLGDSHTAGDYFTGALRQSLQNSLGDGGIGFVPAAKVSGQRTSTMSYGGNPTVLSSRKDSADFAMGGIISRINGSINLGKSDNKLYDMTWLLRPNAALLPLSLNGSSILGNPNYSDWQVIKTQGYLPISVSTSGDDTWDIGLIGLENRERGVTVSALGINGAQLIHTSRWRQNWIQDLAVTQADLVVLAYGTNEAFNNNLDIVATYHSWQKIINDIKITLPHAGIVIIGAPESLRSTSGSCGTRPIKLDGVQAMQEQIAKDMGVLFWSWQGAMGGTCTMKSWVQSGLAAKDGVHFSSKGYKEAGDKLASDILSFIY